MVQCMTQIPETARSIKPTTAYPLNYAVRMAGDMRCPRCDRTLRATDADLDRHGGRLVCRGCHTTLIAIERRERG